MHAVIGYEGPAMDPVYRRVATDFETVKASVEALMDASVTWWAADQLRTRSTRPWNTDGKQLPLVHHANVNLRVKFRDFAAMSTWIGGHVADIEGFRVERIAWALTEKRRIQLIRQVRERAVHDARDRAQLYADSLGLGTVVPVALADAGMLGAGVHPDGGVGSGRPVTRSAMAGSDAAAVELVPQNIEVTASVDARFIAG